VHAVEVPEPDEALGLVLRHPQLHAIGQLSASSAVYSANQSRVAVQPAAPLVERLGVVPVEDRAHRRDAGLAQLVEQAVVEVQPLPLTAPTAVGARASTTR
jgi:hypothetical protein